MLHRNMQVFLLLALCVHSLSASPSRRVNGNVLISESLPSIQIRIDKNIRYIGSFPFKIEHLATGERYVFAETSGKNIRRMFIAQFEAFLPETPEIYRYSFENAMILSGHRFNHNTFAYSNRDALQENPKSEAALTDSFLKQRGFDVADEWIASRFLTLGDESRKQELILFYLEPAASTGHTMNEFSVADQPTDLWKTISAGLKQRSLAAFEVLS